MLCAPNNPDNTPRQEMDLKDLLGAAGATDSIGKLAGEIGIGNSQADDLIGALSPALMRSLQQQTRTSDGLGSLSTALASGNHQKYVDEPDLMSSAESRADGNNILGHLFGSKDVSRNVAAQAAQDTGIDADLIKKALPLIAGLAMGALSKKADAPAQSSDGVADLLGGLLGGGGDDGLGVDDLLGLAKKLF